MEGATLGHPWPQGSVSKGTGFALKSATGEAIPLQSWTLASWPDGSVKWSAHALPSLSQPADSYVLTAGETTDAKASLRVEEDAEGFTVHTGVASTRILKKGNQLIASIQREGVSIAEDLRLVCLVQDNADSGKEGSTRIESFAGSIDSVALEQSGPVRAVVRIQGKHQSSDRAWLPFVLRLYFHAGSQAMRVMHTIVFDGNENKDFIRGLGLRFAVPLRGDLHDRHVRFSGEGEGLFAEAVRGLTGLRRDPGREVTDAQLAGRATPPTDTWPVTVSRRLDLIPAFGDWTLFQPNDGSFEIRKRTSEGHSWLKAGEGRRSSGLAYLGSPKGGVAVGVRNFWQSHPAQIDIRGAAGEKAEMTVWLWAPNAQPMDLRFYHDGLGMDDYYKQNEGMEITYEDYEPGFGTPMGVARTSELTLWALAATPERAQLVQLASAASEPPFLTCTPETLLSAKVFGALWSLPDRSTPAKAAIEDKLDGMFAYYVAQRDHHRWYGFWNYGDVMHSYDAQRHVWKYDVGGFAWDNSELSTDIWLWLAYLRSGRADIFRFAEAMTRHTGEVDVHHLGRFAPLGSRHNVMHWGCSAKQLRISTAQNRRYYYYLTADERVGDLLREQNEAVRTLTEIQPGRKVSFRRGPQGNPMPAPPPTPEKVPGFANVGFGTDWGAVSAAWLTEWERSGDTRYRDRLINSMRTIAKQPKGFFSGASRMNLDTGEYAISQSDRAMASHLASVFGLFEVCAELIALDLVPEFKEAWLQYCTLYNAPGEEQKAALGRALGSLNLRQGHSRLTAYAAHVLGKPELAERAWKEFSFGDGGFPRQTALQPLLISGPDVLAPFEELPFVSTNGTAQWGLAAIQCLALADEAVK